MGRTCQPTEKGPSGVWSQVSPAVMQKWNPLSQRAMKCPKIQALLKAKTAVRNRCISQFGKHEQAVSEYYSFPELKIYDATNVPICAVNTRIFFLSDFFIPCLITTTLPYRHQNWCSAPCLADSYFWQYVTVWLLQNKKNVKKLVKVQSKKSFLSHSHARKTLNQVTATLCHQLRLSANNFACQIVFKFVWYTSLLSF